MSHTRTLDEETLSNEIDQFDLKTRDGINALEGHIREHWTARQIVCFYPFLHGGKFISDAGWVRNSSGHVTQTHEEDSALTRLFDGLRDTCHNYIGAASALEMNGARLFGGYCFADRKDGPSLLDFTINELRDQLPEGLRERIEKETRPLEEDRNNARNRQGGIDRQTAELKKKLAEAEKERDAARAELLKMRALSDPCAVV